MTFNQKHRRQNENSYFKAFSRVFLIFLILSIAQFSIISAWEFDNVLKYSNNDL